MHPEARAGAERMLRMLAYTSWRADIAQRTSVKVLDIGGADINGTVHDLLGVKPWVVDARFGTGVDYVVSCTDPDAAEIILESARHNDYLTPDDLFDLVICTEVLEHVYDWRAILNTAAACLGPEGALVLTCAGEGRAPHGAWGAGIPGPGEWYANVYEHDLRIGLRSLFVSSYVEYNPQPGDLYAWARGPIQREQG